MSIRLIARELYRLYQEAKKIEKQLDGADWATRKRLEDQLRKIKADQTQMRRALDGMIDQQ